MGLETATYINDLVTTNPDGATDPKSAGDNHLRLIKEVLKATFPGMAGRVNRLQAKSGDYTALSTDNLSLLNFSAAATLSLTAVATLGNGWMLGVYARGGDVTVDPNSSETVNGASTVTLKRGRLGLLYCDGSACYLFEIGQQNSSVPAGTVADFAGSSAPDGWLLCYGQAVSRTTYADLYAAIGTQYGTGDGSTTFNLPDCRGRVAAGKDDMGGSAASRLTNGVSGVAGATLGAVGGSQAMKQHSHSVTDPSHSHGVTDPGHTHNLSGGNDAANAGGWVTVTGTGALWGASGVDSAATGISINSASTGISIQNSGSGSSENVQPTIIFNKIIKT